MARNLEAFNNLMVTRWLMRKVIDKCHASTARLLGELTAECRPSYIVTTSQPLTEAEAEDLQEQVRRSVDLESAPLPYSAQVQRVGDAVLYATGGPPAAPTSRR